MASVTPYSCFVATHSAPSGKPPLTANALAVTRHLLVHGPASRSRLGEHLSLSDASMSRVAQTLMRDGIVLETLDPRSRRGPTPPDHVGHPDRQARRRGEADGRHRLRRRLRPVRRQCSARPELRLPPRDTQGHVPVTAAVRVIARLVQRLTKRLPALDGVGVSLGGIVDERAVVREGSFLGWRDVDLAEQLRERSRCPWWSPTTSPRWHGRSCGSGPAARTPRSD